MGSEAPELEDYEANPKAFANGVVENVGSEDKTVGDYPLQTGFGPTFNRIFWHGGSVYDAWLNAVAAQVGQVILSLPTSYAQMGLKLGIFFHFFYLTIGVWTCYLLARLYIEYRNREEKKHNNFKNHVIQYHEVIQSLVGRRARNVVLFFNIMTMGSVATVQIIACASNGYYLSSRFDKRQWALIFGGVSMLTVMLPTMHNFRIFSLVGVLTTTYTAWYILAATLIHGQTPGVKHTGPRNLVELFTGTTNILFATGGHAITIEIMHAMWRPRKYKYVYVLTSLYVLSITVPHCVALYWAFGDILFTHSNALGVLPPSTARSIAIVFMITHQAVAFGLYVMPLYLMWEKLFGIHSAWFPIRAVARLPVAGFLWFLALLLPFFGPLNSVIGAVFMSFSTFMIPCAAYLYVFWTKEARQNAAEKMSKFLPRWKGVVVVNILVIIAVATLGTGLGSYASIVNIKNQFNTFGVFAKCYQC